MTALERLCQRIDAADWIIELERLHSGDLILKVRNPAIKLNNGKFKVAAQEPFDPAKPDAAVNRILKALLLDT